MPPNPPVARAKEVFHVSAASIASTFGPDPTCDHPGAYGSCRSCSASSLSPDWRHRVPRRLHRAPLRDRGDGSGRIALPLPPLPQPTDEYRYWDPSVLDVTTGGPLTVVYYVADHSTGSRSRCVDFGLFAVQLDDVGGVLQPDPGSPVRLTLPADVGFVGVNPNRARQGSFSPSRDRLALVAISETASVLMTAGVDRDAATSKITGLSDLVVVADLTRLAFQTRISPARKVLQAPSITLPTGAASLHPSTTICGWSIWVPKTRARVSISSP